MGIQYCFSPIGYVYAVEKDGYIVKINFSDYRGEESPNEVTKECVKQLSEYFDGKRKTFDFRMKIEGSPLFRSVIDALLEIPYGETRSYKQIAKRSLSPNAVRAVSTMIGKNPLAIVAPCHRVIGSDGKLHGYGGGLYRKEFLLRLEQQYT